MGRSSSSESVSKAAKKDGDKKAKKNSKKEAKKAKKEAKKEAKKAKKLAKQIKKLEEEVEKRKRQIKGEVQEKKKKKKSSSSSSSSSTKKLKKSFMAASGKQPEPVSTAEEQLPEQRLNSQEMQWSDFPEGDYAAESNARPQEPESDREESPPSLESSSDESDPEVHEGAVCDHCDMQPILGPRFKCASCEDVSLCKKCYKRRLEIHRPSHRFFAMKPMKSDLPPKRPERGAQDEEMEEAERADKARKAEKVEERAAERKPSHEGETSGFLPAAERRQPEAAPTLAPAMVPAPVIVPALAQEVASQMQERLLNMGKGYAKSWQESVPTLQDPSAKKAAKAPKTEPTTKVGKQMKTGATCGLCLQKVLDSASGVLCFRIRPDGTEAGCSKAVCFPCMGRASARMFGKARVNKEIWVAMGAEAWWMHERCMAPEEVAEHAELVKSTGLEDSLKANAKLPKGWVSKISKTTGKVYYVNAKKGKTQWTLPEEEVEEPQEPTEQATEAEAIEAREDVEPQGPHEELTEL